MSRTIRRKPTKKDKIVPFKRKHPKKASHVKSLRNSYGDGPGVTGDFGIHP